MRFDKRPAQSRRVTIVGGGLAGIAAASALCEVGYHVELFESRTRLGGRAASFYDPSTGQYVDHCQHVGMGCCTNLLDFCTRTDTANQWDTERVYHFMGPDGSCVDFAPNDWLPAPLHLVPAIRSLSFLTSMERLRLLKSIVDLSRVSNSEAQRITTGHWLVRTGQSENVVRTFWSSLLTSALSEELDQISLAATRKVLLDGLARARSAANLLIPRVPLAEIFDRQISRWLVAQGVKLHLGTTVKNVMTEGSRVTSMAALGQEKVACDVVLICVPWWQLGGLLGESVQERWPQLRALSNLQPVPISAVHLWLDRPLTSLRHAVITGRLCQWIFQVASPDAERTGQSTGEFHYQVVISASRAVVERDKQQVLREVENDLSEVFLGRRTNIGIVRSRIVTEKTAVFSPRPGSEQFRLPQTTPFENLFLAGDWTTTGWPATMESAIRSGYLAAEGIARRDGIARNFLVGELPREGFSRWICRE